MALACGIFEPEIRAVIDANRRVFEDLGCVLEEAEPDFARVDLAFPTLRYAGNHPQYAALLAQKPEWVKDTSGSSSPKPSVSLLRMLDVRWRGTR